MIKPLPHHKQLFRDQQANFLQIAHTSRACVRLSLQVSERERHASSCPHALHTERYAMSEIPRADEVPGSSHSDQDNGQHGPLTSMRKVTSWVGSLFSEDNKQDDDSYKEKVAVLSE